MAIWKAKPLFIVAFISVLCSMDARAASLNTVTMSSEEFNLPNVAAFKDTQDIIAHPEKFQEQLKARGYVDWIKYSWIKCDVNWNETCSSNILVEAPPKWQACKELYSVQTQMNKASYNVSERSFYTNDPESPDRFRAYNFYLRATGSGNIFNQTGSTMTLANVGLRLIRANADNETRYRLGCDMPIHD